ncbi:hypothetical protein RCA_02710 [Rickettsia canadensis str. CA410]|uniref:Uncharacterized protein n=1 Tax=Rickettsia canadensis str. CA410 TaxID=1105107 RepID=A0ABM5MSP3_RICCA|nr:hypothetical protein RCA_02710 [Rickettsia canadensis str. CA410]
MTNCRKVGDIITKASSWSNSTRFAGIQFIQAI